MSKVRIGFFSQVFLICAKDFPNFMKIKSFDTGIQNIKKDNSWIKEVSDNLNI